MAAIVASMSRARRMLARPARRTDARRAGRTGRIPASGAGAFDSVDARTGGVDPAPPVGPDTGTTTDPFAVTDYPRGARACPAAARRQDTVDSEVSHRLFSLSSPEIPPCFMLKIKAYLDRIRGRLTVAFGVLMIGTVVT